MGFIIILVVGVGVAGIIKEMVQRLRRKTVKERRRRG